MEEQIIVDKPTNKQEIKIRKPKEERIYVKSNKGTKIELKNLEEIKLIEESEDLDPYTKSELNKIKNQTFKNNILDLEKKKIVSSVRLMKKSKLGRLVQPMIWEYYKNRGNLDVNQVIKQYGRDNLVINYSIKPEKKIIVESNCGLDDTVSENNNNSII